MLVRLKRSITHRLLRRSVLLVVCWLGVAQAPASAATRDAQRHNFQQAVSAINAGDMATFYAMESKLRNYVLHDHLRFLLAERAIEKGELSAAKHKALQYEAEFHGTSLAWRIMRSYRERLREDEQWQMLLDSAALPSAPGMLCETLRAKEQLGLLQSSDANLVSQWEKRTWAADCEWVVQRHLAAGTVSAKNLWQHVYALMDRGRLQSTEEFKKHFNSRDQALIQAWIVGHEQPEQALQGTRWHDNTELNRRVFKHLISRLSRQDAAKARLYWGEAHREKRYDTLTRNEVARQLSLRAASDYFPDAIDWFRWLPADSQDKRTRAERVRLAVRLGRWQEVLDAIAVMPSEQRALSDWRYWSAVASLELGQKDKAREELLALAKTRSYYGFMAADRLDLPYQMSNKATPAKPALRTKLQARPDLQRMREYLFVGLRSDAQAQWKAVIKKLDADQRAEFSLLALDWGWFDRAIVSNGRTSHSDDLRVRFPFAFEETVRKESKRHKLALPWVYGVARRESLFQPEVHSGVGAIGLMQMMPSTAKDVARRAKKKLYIGALEDPDFNIALGTFYLRYLLDRFDGNEVLATAAYNAGLSRAPRWLDVEPMSADRWVEGIPYRETRDYVKAVMAYATVYDWRVDGRVDTRLSQRMPVMPAAK